MENKYKDKLLELFGHCINNEKLQTSGAITRHHFKNCSRSNGFNDSRMIKTYNQFNIPLGISHDDYSKAILQHKLHSNYTFFDKDKITNYDDLEIKLGDLPNINLTFKNRNSISSPIEKTFMTKLNWFKTRPIKVFENIYNYELFYILSQGALQVQLSMEEAIDLFKSYEERHAFFTEKHDLEKLEERIKKFKEN